MSDKTMTAWAIERDLADDLADALREIMAWHGSGTADANGAKCETFGEAEENARQALAEYDEVHPA